MKSGSKDKDYILTLDNEKRYVLTKTVLFETKKYVFLVELENPTDFIIGELVDDEIIEVEDLELVGRLVLEFAKIA